MTDLPFKRDPHVIFGENTIRWIAAHPELLADIGFREWCIQHHLSPTVSAKVQYDLLTAADKNSWEERAMKKMEEYITLSPQEQHMRNQKALNDLLIRNDQRARDLFNDIDIP